MKFIIALLWAFISFQLGAQVRTGGGGVPDAPNPDPIDPLEQSLAAEKHLSAIEKRLSERALECEPSKAKNPKFLPEAKTPNLTELYAKFALSRLGYLLTNNCLGADRYFACVYANQTGEDLENLLTNPYIKTALEAHCKTDDKETAQMIKFFKSLKESNCVQEEPRCGM